jgi:hypothetical protein
MSSALLMTPAPQCNREECGIRDDLRFAAFQLFDIPIGPQIASFEEGGFRSGEPDTKCARQFWCMWTNSIRPLPCIQRGELTIGKCLTGLTCCRQTKLCWDDSRLDCRRAFRAVPPGDTHGFWLSPLLTTHSLQSDPR